MLLRTVASLTFLLPIIHAAHADAVAYRQTVCSAGSLSSDNDCPGSEYRVGDRITVSIAPYSSDAGRPGAHYIAAHRQNTDGTDTVVAFNGNQWLVTDTVVAEAAAQFSALPSSYRSYVVVDRQFVCSMTGPGKIELWAGYGALSSQTDSLIEATYSGKTNIDLAHIRAVYIGQDMLNGQKYWPVLTVNC